MITITENDVMFGRGKGPSNHPGNKRFRLVAKLYKDKYQATSRGEKAMVSHAVLDIMRSYGSRFLYYDSSSCEYQEVPYARAFQKVAHVLREPRHHLHAKKVFSSNGDSSTSYKALLDNQRQILGYLLWSERTEEPGDELL